MAVALTEWLDLIDREYLRTFISQGGAAVKFVVSNDARINEIGNSCAQLAERHGFVFASVNSAAVRLHMMQDIFFAVSRQIDWDADAQRFMEGLFQRKGYQWPRAAEPVEFKEIADANQVDGTILRRELNTWLTHDLMEDANMAQDFRIAVSRLCQNRLVPAGHAGDTVAPILQWLRGDLKLISALKNDYIYSKITRHNARAMLRSLCRWLRLAGHKGLCLTIDIRQIARPAVAVGEGVRYTPGAVMDAYEVMRQLVDDADLFEGFFLVVLADHDFTGGDPKRSIDAYTALKMRIWDDVRARAQDNPLAPLVVV